MTEAERERAQIDEPKPDPYVEGLRELANEYFNPDDVESMLACEAADLITALQAENAKLVAALEEAVRLLRVAEWACSRLGLKDRGADCSLSHEVRMFAFNFSAVEEPKTPQHVLLNGNGAYRALWDQAKDVLSAHRKRKEEGS